MLFDQTRTDKGKAGESLRRKDTDPPQSTERVADPPVMKKENLAKIPSFLRAFQALFPYKQGFTLTELLVTLAIMAIVTAIAIPSFQVMNASSNCRGAARTLHTDLALAKMRAISQGKKVKIVFANSTSYKFQIEDGTWQDLVGEAVRDLTIASSPYFFKDVIFGYANDNNPATPAGGKEVVFLPTGSCQTCGSGSSSITVQNTGNTRKITVDRSGKIEQIKL